MKTSRKYFYCQIVTCILTFAGSITYFILIFSDVPTSTTIMISVVNVLLGLLTLLLGKLVNIHVKIESAIEDAKKILLDELVKGEDIKVEVKKRYKKGDWNPEKNDWEK